MIEYIYNPTLWAIVGVILVLLELSDGSKIFFLPLGLASISTGIIVYLQNTGSFNELILLKYWHSPLLSLAALALFDLVKALNSVDFPTLGSPTIPQLNPTILFQ